MELPKQLCQVLRLSLLVKGIARRTGAGGGLTFRVARSLLTRRNPLTLYQHLSFISAYNKPDVLGGAASLSQTRRAFSQMPRPNTRFSLTTHKWGHGVFISYVYRLERSSLYAAAWSVVYAQATLALPTFPRSFQGTALLGEPRVASPKWSLRPASVPVGTVSDNATGRRVLCGSLWLLILVWSMVLRLAEKRRLLLLAGLEHLQHTRCSSFFSSAARASVHASGGEISWWRELRAKSSQLSYGNSLYSYGHSLHKPSIEAFVPSNIRCV